MEGEKEGVVMEQPKRLKSFCSEQMGLKNVLIINNLTPYSLCGEGSNNAVGGGQLGGGVGASDAFFNCTDSGGRV